MAGRILATSCLLILGGWFVSPASLAALESAPGPDPTTTPRAAGKPGTPRPPRR